MVIPAAKYKNFRNLKMGTASDLHAPKYSKFKEYEKTESFSRPARIALGDDGILFPMKLDLNDVVSRLNKIKKDF